MQSEADAEKEFAEIANGASPEDQKRAYAEKLKLYAHSHLKHFSQIDINTVQGVFMYEGSPYVATFYRSVDDLIADSWSLSIDHVVVVGSETIPDEALTGEWVMRCKRLDDDDN